MTIDAITQQILQEEGAQYTDNPADSGGPTKYGVTQATLAQWRGHPVTPQDVQNLTADEAGQIARQIYFVRPGFSQLEADNPDLAAKLYNAGYNCGPQIVAQWLQRVLNVMNQQASVYPDLTVDGKIGPATLNALHDYNMRRGPEGKVVLLRAINDLQGAYYIELAERRQKDEAFVYGWLRNRVQ